MSGWGIAETAPVIEKIKAESADYLRGLNSCGEITWSVYDKAFDFYMELISRAYEQGKKDVEPQWIPCSERLPEEDVEVLITYRYKEGEGDTSHADIDITTYGQMYFGGNKVGNYKHWRAPFEYFASNYEVIAWMPLPEPYKESDTE